MSEDNNGTPEGGAPADAIGNLKAELNRKLSNSDARLADLQKSNEALMAKLDSISRPKAAAASTEQSMSDLLYADPARYAELIAEKSERRVMESVRSQQDKIVKQSNTIQQIAAEYPEVGDQNHPLTKKAVEIYNALSDEEKQSSLSYKLAVREAADELNIKPRSKRPADEEPSFGSGYQSGSRSARRVEKLDKGVETLASVFGIDTSDAKVKSRLIEGQNRNWSKYQPLKKGK